MIFINTRPTTKAISLTESLQHRDISVLELPLLELVPCKLAGQEKHHLYHVNTYKALIFISETAVRYFFEFIKTHQIRLNPKLVIIAVGQKTMQTFVDVWHLSMITPPHLLCPSQFNLPENNEGLLQLPFIKALEKRSKVLTLKGKDGRDLLKNTLTANGIQVDSVDFYQRIFPATSEAIFQNFYQSLLPHQIFLEKIVVLISSFTAWQHWQTLCGKFEVDIKQFDYIILQSRIFNRICPILPQSNLVKVDDLLPNTIILALKNLTLTQ